LARRAQVPAPTLRARFQPRAPDGRAIKPRLLISAIACLLPAATLAGPKDGQVVAGQSSISTPDANTTIIRQSTDKSVINWQSFSVGTKEYVKFVQPGKSSISLNRVIGGNPSAILGTLSANGQVYLVNPNGIYFGEGARVDVSGIVASVLDISNTDFMSGNFVFEGSADENLGKVINDGIINARNEGYVVLMGDYSENNGVIQAHMGKVVLASGSRITMDISGNSLISVAVDEAAVNDLAGVRNTGEIYADGGRVIMTARVADSLIGSAVNNEGLVRANSIVENDGAIFLTAIGGDVANSGTLDASAAADSNVDGGGVLVYSDRDITLSSGAAIHARGDGDGAGGVVRVIAEEVLDHQQGAGISVAGSPHAGGFVEVSGHGGLRLRGEVDLGSGGTLVIDPNTFTIITGGSGPTWDTSGAVGSAFLAGKLNKNNDVYVVADTLITADPGVAITATSPTNTTAGVGDLNLVIGTLEATGSGAAVGGSSYSSQCNSAGFCVGGGVGNFRIKSDPTGDIRLGNVNFDLDGGLNVRGGTVSGIVELGDITAAGNVEITNGQDVVINNNVTVGGNLLLKADVDDNGIGDVLINGSTSETRTVLTGGDLNVSGQNFNVNGADFGSSGVSTDQNVPVNVKANRVIVNINGDMNVVGGRVNLDVNFGASGGGGTTKTVDTSVKVTGTSMVSVTANNLTVQGGTAAASVSDTQAYASTAKALTNAELAAGGGGSMSVNLGGSLTLQAGKATARQFDASADDLAMAEANVTLSAGGKMTLIVDNGISVNAGTALASAQGSGSTFGSPTNTSANAVANATLDAGANLGITIANGSLLIQGGTATARATYSSGGFRLASASANALVKSGGTTTVAITTAGLTVRGGTATAEVSASNSDDASAFAHANADLQVSGNLNIDSVGTDLRVRGGMAAARIKGSIGDGSSSTCSTCNVHANANAGVQAGNITVANLGDNFVVSGGTAEANIRVNTYIEGSAGMHANANAAFSGNSVNVTAAGSINVDGGTARAGGSWTGGSATNQVHADALLEAVSTNVNLNGSTVAVNGGNASVGEGTSVSGHVGTLDATAKGEIIAARDVVIEASNGLSVSAGNADASFDSVFNISAVANANAKVHAGRDMYLTVASGNINVQGGNALARPDQNVRSGFASANAFAKLSASGNISIDVGNTVNVFAEDATVRGFGDSANTIIAKANADAVIDAGGNLNVTAVTGLYVFGGSASANPNTSGSTNGTASASAKAELKAGGLATINVTGGSVEFEGGISNPGCTSYCGSSGRATARASGSSGTTPLRKAFANASVKAGQLQVMAATDVYGNSADIDAKGIYIAAGNDLHLFNTTTTVGNGVAPGVSGDPLVLDIMERAGIPLPAHNDPNLKFQAGGTMHTGDIEATASNAYLWFETDEVLSVSNISAPVGPLTVQYSPFTPTLGIVFEDQPPSLDLPPQDIIQRGRLAQARPLLVNYDNSNLISSFPMTTVVLGSAQQSGPMTVGANGPIDIVARNILLLTTPDNVNSPDNVITTGIVATSGFVASGREVFITPRLDSFEVETETIWDEEEERKRQLVETPEEDHGMCTAL